MTTITVLSVLLLAFLSLGRPCQSHSIQVPRECPLTGTPQNIRTLADDVTTTSRDLLLAYCENHDDVNRQLFLQGRPCTHYLPRHAESYDSLPTNQSSKDEFEELYRRAVNYKCTLRTARCLYHTAECEEEGQGQGQGQACDTAAATVQAQDTDTYCTTVGPLYDQAHQKLHSLIINLRGLAELKGIPRGQCPPLDWADTEDRIHDILTSLYGAKHLGTLINNSLHRAYCTME